MGKGTLLRRAAEFMAELAEKVARSDADIAKREVEKSELQVSAVDQYLARRMELGYWLK
jgi:ABC-type cobalamin/Fe3+-siderophores transport system ATPase subunit